MNDELSPDERSWSRERSAFVDSVCDAYEKSWRRDPATRIEDFLAAAADPLRAELACELIRAHMELMSDSGRPIDIEGLRRRFPEHATAIRDAAASVDGEPAAPASSFAIHPTISAPPSAGTERNSLNATLDLHESAAIGESPRVPGRRLGSNDEIDEKSVAAPADRNAASRKLLADAAASWVGRRIGVYRIDAEIARGGMGVVYKATDERLQRVVAIKMILGGRFASPEAVRRFFVEAQAAAALDHVGIVPIHEVNVHEDVHYYVMGFIDGASLESELKRGPIPARRAADLILAAAEAAGYAHERGVVHRDIKPANILLDGDGRPRIADFGLAKIAGSESDLTADGQVLGTPGYMAPEQAAGQAATCGPATDVYSIGAVLYEALAGRPPFQASTYAEALDRVQHDDPKPPREFRSDVPIDLQTICLKCLRKTPSQRYETANELAADLRRFLSGERILARPMGPMDRVAVWARQRPALATTWAAMMCFLLYHLSRLFITHEIPFGGRENLIVMATVAVWSFGAWWFQRRLERTQSPGDVSRRRAATLYAWAAMDVVLLTIFLLQFDGPRSAYVMGYLVLTAGAALRFRPELLWLVTASSLAGYLLVLGDAVWRRPDKLPDHSTSNAMFLVGLLTIAVIQAMLLRRIRREFIERPS